MFIKFDDNNMPEYGFTFNEFFELEKIINLSDKELKEVVIPNTRKYYHKDMGWDCVKISQDCFKGLDNLDIVIPSSRLSASFDKHAFDEGAHINFVLPKDNILCIEQWAWQTMYRDYFFEDLLVTNPNLKKNINRRFVKLEDVVNKQHYNYIYKNFTAESLDEYVAERYPNKRINKPIIKAGIIKAENTIENI